MISSDILTDNPIFMREIRRRMRGRALILTMILYIAAMCILAYLIIHSKSDEIIRQQIAPTSPYNTSGYGYNYNYRPPGSYTTISSIGQTLYSTIVAIQSILVLIIAPTITAAMVKSEKERQTFEFLKVTTISAPMYIIGALLSTVLYVALALFCALPVLTIAYLYGGVQDLVDTTINLLIMSIVLSSAGLLLSCTTEKSRAGQAPVAFAVALVAVFLFGGRILFAGLALPSLLAAKVTVSGYSIPQWFIAGILALLLSWVLLLIATRKIFHPEERALSYKQLTILQVVIVGACLLWVLVGQRTQGGATLSAGDRLPFLNILVLLLGIGAQNTVLLNRVEIGNERWRLKKLHSAWRDKDEALWFTIALLAAEAVVLFGAHIFAYPGDSFRWWGAAPVITYLAAHAGMCRLLSRLVENEFKMLKIVVVIDAVLLMVPPVLGAIPRTFGGSLPILESLAGISPLEAASSLRTLGNTYVGLLGFVIYFGATGLIWIAAHRTRDAHENTHVNYDLAL